MSKDRDAELSLKSVGKVEGYFYALVPDYAASKTF